MPLIKLTSHNSVYPGCLINAKELTAGGGKVSRTEFHNYVYPVLAAMAPYNEYMAGDTKRPLVNALQNGLLSKDTNKTCIVALTACALEMKARTCFVFGHGTLCFGGEMGLFGFWALTGHPRLYDDAHAPLATISMSQGTRTISHSLAIVSAWKIA